MKQLKLVLGLRLMLLCFGFILLSCSEDEPNPFENAEPGWQQSEDMYDESDYSWKEITTSEQLQGTWYGSLIVTKPEEYIFPEYDLLVSVKFVHFATSSSIFTFEETHYFTDAIDQDEDWESLREYLAGRETGATIHAQYPGVEISEQGGFYGEGSAGFAMMQSSHFIDSQTEFEEFVNQLSLQIDETETKLRIQYAENLPIVLGLRE